MGEFLSRFDFWIRLDAVWHLLIDNPEAVVLTAFLGATLGWYARRFAHDKPRLIKLALPLLVVVAMVVIGTAEYAKNNRIQITAMPKYPWLESPSNREPNTDYAIRARILAHVEYKEAQVTLLNVYKFYEGSWGNSLNSGVAVPVAWYAASAFDKQTVRPGEDTYIEPFLISEPGDVLQFILPQKPQVIEITRWASRAIPPGQYKFSFVLESSNQASVSFDFFLNWYGSPATIDFHIAPHS